MRTASIKLNVTSDQSRVLSRLHAAYADTGHQLVPFNVENRCWNRLAYFHPGTTTPLGSQMRCNAIKSVFGGYKAQKTLKRLLKDSPVPVILFNRASVHFDKRTYTLKGNDITVYTLEGRNKIRLAPDENQAKILSSGTLKEAELVFLQGSRYFNLVIESKGAQPVDSGAVLGLDVGENNLPSVSKGKVWSGGDFRHCHDGNLAFGTACSPKARQVPNSCFAKSPARCGVESNRIITKPAGRL
jgi:putative transposase